jgi:hypothetical protein
MRRLRLLSVLIVGMTGCSSGGPAGDAPDAGDVTDGDPTAWDLQPAPADAPLIAMAEQGRGVYPVGSRVRDRQAPGGFGPCARYPKDLGDRDWSEPGKLSVVAFPDEAVRFGKYRGLTVRLINRTGETVAFQACDSCLYLVQEARTAADDWRPIESLPEAICGNSFHRVFLKPNQYWEFPAPRYEGPVKTRLRLRLDPGGEQDRSRPPVYSSEFDGSIHMGQFEPIPKDDRR